MVAAASKTREWYFNCCGRSMCFCGGQLSLQVMVQEQATCSGAGCRFPPGRRQQLAPVAAAGSWAMTATVPIHSNCFYSSWLRFSLKFCLHAFAYCLRLSDLQPPTMLCWLLTWLHVEINCWPSMCEFCF